MDQPHPLPDPVPDHPIEFKRRLPAASCAAQAAAGPPDVCAELDRYEIAVIVKAVYEWGGYRYTNASDAIAAAKRGAK